MIVMGRPQYPLKGGGGDNRGWEGYKGMGIGLWEGSKGISIGKGRILGQGG